MKAGSSFTGVAMDKKNQLSWTTISEINNVGFQLQRSADGAIFTDLYFIPSQTVNGNSVGNLSYTFNDVAPIKGVNYYRLKQIDKDGKQTFSSIVSLKNSATSIASINVYPNPIKGNTFSLLLNNIPIGSYDLYIIDRLGKGFFVQSIACNSLNNAVQVQLHSKQFAKGIYTVQLRANQFIQSTQLLID